MRVLTWPAITVSSLGIEITGKLRAGNTCSWDTSIWVRSYCVCEIVLKEERRGKNEENCDIYNEILRDEWIEEAGNERDIHVRESIVWSTVLW